MGVVQDYQEAQRRDEQSGSAQSQRRLPAYGQQRLWGAAGWGGASLLGGALMDFIGVTFMFATCSILFAVMALVIATQFPSKHSRRTGSTEQGTQQRFLR